MNKTILLLITLGFLGFSCSKSEEVTTETKMKQSQIKSYYTCSMHPQIKEDKPGKCPICHMNLTKVEVDESEEAGEKSIVQSEKWRCKDFPDVMSDVEDVCPLDPFLPPFGYPMGHHVLVHFFMGLRDEEGEANHPDLFYPFGLPSLFPPFRFFVLGWTPIRGHFGNEPGEL